MCKAIDKFYKQFWLKMMPYKYLLHWQLWWRMNECRTMSYHWRMIHYYFNVL